MKRLVIVLIGVGLLLAAMLWATGLAGASRPPGARPAAVNPSDMSGPDSWSSITTTNAPSVRAGHTAVWTGKEMLVWGGGGENTGGRYDLTTDAWSPIATTNAPSARYYHAAVWTGREMLVWGGLGDYSFALGDGARYNPVTDDWSPITSTNSPRNPGLYEAVWTGSEMLIWGGWTAAPSILAGATTRSWIFGRPSPPPMPLRSARVTPRYGLAKRYWFGEARMVTGCSPTAGVTMQPWMLGPR